MSNIKPHLACDADLDLISYPVMVMPKIDGVRGISLENRGLTARTLKPFANRYLTWFFSQAHFRGFDGEFAAHSNPTFDRLCSLTTSLTNTIAAHGTLLPTWWIFDYITQETLYLPYVRRYEIASEKVLALKSASPNLGVFLQMMPYIMAKTPAELDTAIQSHLEAGYEGTVLRKPTGLHKSGRATAREANFTRVKEFCDAEGTIIGFTEGLSNYNPATINELGLTERSSHKENKVGNGMLGSLQLLTPEGLEITVSAGSLPHLERQYYFHNFKEILGKKVTYKYFPKGIKRLPRFPTIKYSPGIDFIKQLRSDIL